MNILRQLSELENSGVITKETSESINQYYLDKKGQSSSHLLMAFGILGSVLVGLGIILILAHNWDTFSRGIKLIIAFAPLIIGQVLCGYSLFKKKNSAVLKESSSAFLFISIGACISLVSQIYHIPGSIGSFLLTWMLLGLPIVYVMRSSMASLLYVAGITYYAVESGYKFWGATEPYYYWLMLLGVLPFYIFLIRKKSDSNFLSIHNWVLPLSVVITLGTIANHHGKIMMITYMSLFGLLYVFGNMKFLRNTRLINNGPRVLGSLGSIGLLTFLTFGHFWERLERNNYLKFEKVISSPEMIAAIVFSVLAIVLVIYNHRNRSYKDLKPLSVLHLLFILTFVIGMYTTASILIINLLVLFIGVFMIRDGAISRNLGVLNRGLLVIAVLTTCRYFDTNISFVVKGLLFLSVGVAFFVGNYLVIKKRNQTSKNIQS